MSAKNLKQEDPIIVSFHDSIVRQSNLNTLEQNNWLDDNIITFAFEYLQNHPKLDLIFDNVFFVSPPVVQLIKMIDDDSLIPILQSMEFSQKKYLILPVNNNERVQEFAGSHWSLLILSIQSDDLLSSISHSMKSFMFHFFLDKVLYSFDSSFPLNAATTKTLQKKFRLYFHEDVPLVNCSCPQQKNGHDCGIYVIKFAEEWNRFLNETENSSIRSNEKVFVEKFLEKLHRSVTQDQINERRKELKKVLETLSRS